MSDRNHVGGQTFRPTTWTPVPILTAAENYIGMTLRASRPDQLDLARGFATYCETHPEHGYSADEGYAIALEVADRIRYVVGDPDA